MYYVNNNKKYSNTIIMVIGAVLGLYLVKVTIAHFQANQNMNYLIKNPLTYQLPYLVYRHDIAYVLEQVKAEQMIEIGVQTGSFAAALLNKWPSFKNYYGIDPWKHQVNYKDESNVYNDAQGLNYQQTVERLKPWGDKIKLIRDFSKHAVKRFSDYSIDFIYVDGRHDYCAVTEDLSLYYPKLKCGGIMAGGEYFNVEEQYRLVLGDYGICENGERVLTSGGAVKGAVLDFAKRNNILSLRGTNESLASWFFVKPCPDFV